MTFIHFPGFTTYSNTDLVIGGVGILITIAVLGFIIAALRK